MKTKIVGFIFAVVLCAWSAPSSAQLYTYPGWGCSCYGPGINLDECRNAIRGKGVGITVQGYNPSTNYKCGSENGKDFGNRILFGLDVVGCCIQHDLDWSTCEKPRSESDAALGSCAQQTCGGLAFNNKLYNGCMVLAHGMELAVSDSPLNPARATADQAYRDTVEKTCMCSPCGMTGQNCWFDLPPDSLGVYYPPEGKGEPSITPRPGWQFIFFPIFGGGSSKLEGDDKQVSRAVYAKAILDDDETKLTVLKAGSCPTQFWPQETQTLAAAL